MGPARLCAPPARLRWLRALALVAAAGGSGAEQWRELQTSSGCSDSLADNYDPSATSDQDTCTYDCAGLALAVWNETALGSAWLAAATGSESAATCELATVLLDPMPPPSECCMIATPPAGDYTQDCCDGCCGAGITAPAPAPGDTTRLVVQGKARRNHEGVIYQGASPGQLGGLYDITKKLPPLKRTISVGAGTHLAVRQMQVEGITLLDPNALSIISAESGLLLVEDCVFERNNGYSSGVITMSNGGEVHVITSLFAVNSANLDNMNVHRSGGAVSLPAGGVLKITWSVFQQNDGHGGGAIFVGGEGTATVSEIVLDGSHLEGNHLINTGRGGGLSIEAGTTATVVLTYTAFSQNYAAGAAGTGSGAGAVWQKYGSLDAHECSFTPPDGRTVAEGELLTVFELTDWRVVNTVFNDYHPCNGSSILGGCSVYTDGCPSAGCGEHPCQPGQRCEYREMSLWCTDCVWPTVSADGISCLQCPPGRGPAGGVNETQSRCEDCEDGKFSSYGYCDVCTVGKVPSISKTTCNQCPVDFVSVAGLQCERCEHGHQSNARQSFCENCGVYGLEFFSPDGTPCRNCTAGTQPNGTRGECLNCTPGMYSPEGKDCLLCYPGQEPDLRLAATHCLYCNVTWPGLRYSSDGRECGPCPDGSQPVQNHTACEPCPRGMAGTGGTCSVCDPGQQPDSRHHICLNCTDTSQFSVTTHSSAGFVCEACPAGRQPNSERTTCDACARAKYSNIGLCETCEAGYEPNLDVAAVNCTSCAFAGDGMISANGLECTACQPGFEPSPDHTICVACDTRGGYFFSTDGTKCRRCLPGYEVNSAATDCTICTAGTHSTEGAECLHCDNYTSASYSLDGFAECQICHPGSSPNDARSQCVDCAMGYQSPDGTPCQDCSAGNEANPRDSAGIHCTACLANLYRAAPVPRTASISNGTLCTQCASGKQPTQVHDGCSDCQPGYAGIDGVCDQCAKGQEPDVSSHTCVDCVPSSGTFSVDGVQCRNCVAGKQPNIGSTQCDSCYPGRYSDQGISCDVCDLGTEPNIPGVGATSCIPCVGGIGTGSGCDTCPAGSEPNAAATGCELCSVGLHSTEGVCVLCQPGYEPNMLGGATGCVQCVGTHSTGSACQTCGLGSHPSAPVAADACENCVDVDVNAYSDDGLTCELCAPGNEVDAGRSTCTPCQRTQGYHSIDGSTCTMCLAGSEPTAVANGCGSCTMRGEEFISPDGSPCVQCVPGKEPNTARTGCDFCAPGFVSAHGAPCSPCDRGMEPQPDGRACNGCPTGKFTGDGTPCQYCPGGFEPNVDRTVCSPCVNQVSGPTTAYLCQSCPPGQHMVANTVCEVCLDGSASFDGLGCKRCDPGTAPDAGRIQCVPCAPGSYSTDGIRCLSCQPGQQPNLASAATFCQDCATVGGSAYSSNGNTCQNCPPGTGRFPNATGCFDCSTVGLGLASLDGAECKPCAPGSEPTPDSSQCIGCDGIQRVSINGTGCAECPRGWLANEPKTDCFPCTMSGYLEAATTGVCMVEFGSTVPLAGGAACEMCMPGGSGIGDPAYCRTCGIGYAKAGAGPCMPCEVGKVSLQGEECTQCPAGKTSNEVRSACRPCEVFEIFDTFSSQCATCDRGTEVGPGQFACMPCPEGTYSDDELFCKTCMAGKSPDNTATGCKLCPENFASSTGGNCTECSSGYTHSALHTECLLVNGIPPGDVSWMVLVTFIAGLALSCLAGWCSKAMFDAPEDVEISFEDHGTVENPLNSAKGNHLLGLVGRHPVDLVFVVGCTDTMGMWVDLVTAAIQPLAGLLQQRFGATDVRFGFVGFRDYSTNQEVKRFEIAELTDHFPALQAFLASIRPVSPHSDDGPDDITGALEKCTELHWGESTRLVVVLSDTPCHGAKYHGGAPDHFPAGDPSGLNPETIVCEMSRNDVHLYFGRITTETDQMIAILRTAHENTAGHWSKFGAMDANGWPGDRGRFVDVIVDLVTRSVSHTVRHHRENELHPPAAVHAAAAAPEPQAEKGWRDYAEKLHNHQGHPSAAPKVPAHLATNLRTATSRALNASAAFGGRAPAPAPPRSAAGSAASSMASDAMGARGRGRGPPPQPPQRMAPPAPSFGDREDLAPAPPPRPKGTAL